MQPIITGNNPLIGPNDDALGPRFPAMSDAYDEALQDMVLAAAKKLGLSSKVRANGTYCFVSGPGYESKAESRFLRSIGGDSVGMSTIPEVMAAKHCGMKILGLSLITNKVVVSKEEKVHASHAEVLEAVKTSGANVEAIVKEIVRKDVVGNFIAQLPASDYSKLIASSKKKCGLCEMEVGNTIATILGIAAVIVGFVVIRNSR